MNHSRSRSPLPRRRLTLLHFFGLVSLSALCALLTQPPAAHSAAQSEREIENKIPAHLPIKVKVKNLEKVKDLKNEHWLSDLEIEVQNIGDKPIFYMRLGLALVNTTADSGHQIGFPLRYGRPELVDLNNHATAEDVPLRPGETYVFKVPEGMVRGWLAYKSKNHKPQPRKIDIRFDVLSYGDGTGFVTTDGLPVPKQRAASERSGILTVHVDSQSLGRQLLLPG